MAETRHTQPRAFIDALEGIDFPTSKAAIQHKAQDKGGLDTEVMFLINKIPDRTYRSMDEVRDAVESAYDLGGGLRDGGPAAKSRETKRDKDVIESRADMREGEPPGESKTGPAPDLRA